MAHYQHHHIHKYHVGLTIQHHEKNRGKEEYQKTFPLIKIRMAAREQFSSRNNHETRAWSFFIILRPLPTLGVISSKQ